MKTGKKKQWLRMRKKATAIIKGMENDQKKMNKLLSELIDFLKNGDNNPSQVNNDNKDNKNDPVNKNNESINDKRFMNF